MYQLRVIAMRWILLTIFILFLYPSFAQASSFIRVVTYNVSNNPDDAIEDADMSVIFDAIGTFDQAGRSKPADIIVLQETDTGSSVRMVDVINTAYGVSSYTAISSASIGGDKVAVIYDTNVLSIISQSEINNASLTRPFLKVQLTHSQLQNESFYIYGMHLKSGSAGSDKTARQTEANFISNDIASLGGANVIALGDLNLTGSSEGAWTEFMSILFDPANATGEWRDNASFLELHTQNPAASMDDRFDFQLVSSMLIDGAGLEVCNDTYKALGNNGTHTLDGAINTGTGASAAVLNALMSASDHLPLIVDYCFPTASDSSFSASLALTAQGKTSYLLLFALALLLMYPRVKNVAVIYFVNCTRI